MTNDRVELMLEQMSKYQDKLVFYLALGFAVGFMVGVMGAWMMIALGR